MRFLFARGLTNCPPCRRPAFTHAGRATVAERGQHTICRSGRTAERFAASATAGRSRGRTPGCRTSAASQTARTACRFCFWDGFNWHACSLSSNGFDGASELHVDSHSSRLLGMRAIGADTPMLSNCRTALLCAATFRCRQQRLAKSTPAAPGRAGSSTESCSLRATGAITIRLRANITPYVRQALVSACKPDT
jgi:hypothetical protein